MLRLWGWISGLEWLVVLLTALLAALVLLIALVHILFMVTIHGELLISRKWLSVNAV